MFVVTNRIPVAEGHEADFEDRFRHRAHLIDQSPGFIKNLVMRPVQRRFNHQTGRVGRERRAGLLSGPNLLGERTGVLGLDQERVLPHRP